MVFGRMVNMRRKNKINFYKVEKKLTKKEKYQRTTIKNASKSLRENRGKQGAC